MAVELKEPALRLMTFIENNREPELAERFIGDLVSRPLAEIAADPLRGRSRWSRCWSSTSATSRPSARRPSWRGGVVFFDLADQETGAFNKFISYYLFPEARYSVGVTLASRAKISVGANPWAKVPRTHEINKICERYGGGGHPVVGAISIPRARAAARPRDRPRHRRRAAAPSRRAEAGFAARSADRCRVSGRVERGRGERRRV